MKNKVSVIMPVKDGGAYLQGAIKSILEQSHENLELIIMDNGSKDESWKTIMNYKNLDGRIRAIRNNNIGFTRSLNLMLDVASGDYLARVDSDDVSEPERLEKQIKMLEKQSVGLATGKCKVIDEEGNVLYQHGPSENGDELKWNLIFKNEIWHSSVMWRRNSQFRYNESYTYSQDYELWSRVAKKFEIASISELLGSVTKRKTSITSSKKREQEAFALSISKLNMEHYLGWALNLDLAAKVRLVHEGASRDDEALRIYSELRQRFFDAAKPKNKRPIRIKIGKKNKTRDEYGLDTPNMEEKIQISKKRWRESAKKVEDGRNYIWLERESKYAEVKICDHEISPMYGASTEKSPWEGSCERKPWDYRVTAVIPCLNTPETLPICIELLRLQTEKPFIMIIDTGSIKSNLDQVEELRSEDVEVHSIKLHGVRHPSDYPAIGMDLAFSLCRTEYLFATHSDCFLRSRDVLSRFIYLCETKSPVVGYELSPRAHEDWVGMVSHTASMYHMPTMDKIGFGWSLRRLCNRYGIVDYKPDPNKPNWPDTEILGNYILRDNKIEPYLVGKEGNKCRTLDDNIDHFRSYGAAKMYSPDYYPKVSDWYHSAKKDALKRIDEWSN